MFWPTVSYKRLVDGFWAPVKPTWGFDNRTASFRVLTGCEIDAARNALPGIGRQLVSGDGGLHCRGTRRRREEPDARRAADRGTNKGAENIARAPRTLIETTRIFRQSDRARLVR
jgi:glutamine synthetase